jgi:hypothetical protein
MSEAVKGLVIASRQLLELEIVDRKQYPGTAALFSSIIAAVEAELNQPPAAAHAAALARGRYQDGSADCITSAPGFDSRDNSALATAPNGDIEGRGL